MFRFVRYFCVGGSEYNSGNYYEIEATFGKFIFKEFDNPSQTPVDFEKISWNDFRTLCLRISEIVEIKLPNEHISNKEVINLFMELAALFYIKRYV